CSGGDPLTALRLPVRQKASSRSDSQPQGAGPRRASGCRVAAVTLVVLTGATRGIGQAAALELARQGAELALVGREHECVREVASEARATGGGAPVHEHVADLTSMAQVRALDDELKARYEHSDLLANNAAAMF